MISTPKYFKAEDGLELFGILNLPDNYSTEEIIISVHGQASKCTNGREREFSKTFAESGIPYFCFNNRGSEIYTRLKRKVGGRKKSFKYGAMFEKISEAPLDILGAIKFLKKFGFKKFYLLGHSLGCTKILYFYNQLVKLNSPLLKQIKAVILLSPVDIQGYYYAKNPKQAKKSFSLAKKFIKEGKEEELVDSDSGFKIAAKSFVQYFEQEFNVISYNKESNFKYFNQIACPLFIKFGSVNEMIVDSPEKTVELIKEKVANKNLDVGFILGADHSYSEKEKVLAKQILKFIEKNKIRK